MAPARRSNLNIAFIYDSKTDYLAAGYPAIDCADLTDYVIINGVSSALTSLGHNVIHVPGIKPLVQHLAVGKQKNWDLAFNYGEGVHGSARESQVPALLEAYQVPFTFSDPATLAVCIDKAKTKMVLDHFDIPTSPFAVVPKFGQTADYSILAQKLSYPLFAKPVAASTSNGITPSSKILRREDLEPNIEDIRTEFKDQEILLEEFLAGREFTVAILGTGDNARVLGTSEITWYNPEGKTSEDIYIDFATSSSKSGRGPGHDLGHTHVDPEDPLVKKVAEAGLSAYKASNCRHSGRVDIRLKTEEDDSAPCVLEVNPIFGLRPDYSLFTWIARNNGLEYVDMIAVILDEALQDWTLANPTEYTGRLSF